ncbi:MAG: pilin [Acinetobacter gerneri]|nr:pilin [Acinetobacter gerneri]
MEGFKVSSGLQADIGVFTADNGRLPKADDLAAGGAALAIADQAQALAGKYIAAKGVSVGDEGVITVTYNAGSNNGKTMTITPTLNTANTQITKWTCAGGGAKPLEKERLPTSCQ